MKNASSLIKTISKLQQNMDNLQKQIAGMSFQGSAGGGLVQMVMTGKGDVLSVTLNPSVMTESSETLADLIMAAINSANSAKEVATKAQLGSVAAGVLPLGLKIPGLS